MGASDTLDFTTMDEEGRHEWVQQRTGGRGADVTIECTGAPEAATQAMRYTRDAGRVVIVGQYTDHGETPFNPHLDLNKKHLQVRGCWGSDYGHFHRAVEMLHTEPGGTRWDAVKLDRYTLSTVNEALEAVEAGRAVKALVAPTE
jgi:L-iditol 2-dehydrogenase